MLSRVCVPSGVLPIFSLAKLGKKTAFHKEVVKPPTLRESEWIHSLSHFSSGSLETTLRFAIKTKGFIRYPVQLNSAL